MLHLQVRLCLETSIAICAMLYQYLLYCRFFPVLSCIFSAVLSSFTSFTLKLSGVTVLLPPYLMGGCIHLLVSENYETSLVLCILSSRSSLLSLETSSNKDWLQSLSLLLSLHNSQQAWRIASILQIQADTDSINYSPFHSSAVSLRYTNRSSAQLLQLSSPETVGKSFPCLYN